MTDDDIRRWAREAYEIATGDQLYQYTPEAVKRIEDLMVAVYISGHEDGAKSPRTLRAARRARCTTAR